MNEASAKEKKFYRHAYLWFFLALAVIVTGFFNSFFTKITETDIAHHFHGITATAWLLLLIIQPFLYSRGSMALHRKLGKISFFIAPLIIIGGLLMIHTMINSKELYPPFVVYQLSFLDFFYLLQFSFFYIMAIKYHRQTQYHARYIAGTVLVLLPPGIARALFLIPGINDFTQSLNITYGIVELILLLLLLDDKRSGKIRPPYVIALVCFVIQHIALQSIAYWEPWQKLMDRFASI